MNKTCFKCGQTKPRTEFYPHPQMGDGLLGKCKDCTKKDTKERTDALMKNPEWAAKEAARHREKARRLGNKKPTREASRKRTAMNRSKYPEKVRANSAVQRFPVAVKGNHLHHWSYRPEHQKDVMELTPRQHGKAHRFIVYDQERSMYRRVDSGELLDTRAKHSAFIMEMIETQPD